MLRHLIIGPGPCNFEILDYRLFLESVCVGKQELGLVSDPSLKGHEIPPPSSSIYTALRAPFRLWVLFRLKVHHSCNFMYLVCVQRPDQDRLRIPTIINTSYIFAIFTLLYHIVARSSIACRNRPSWSG